VDLEEELEDVPVGGPLGIEDDLDRLGVTRMVIGGGVVVLSAGVADAGGYDSVAVAQQFLCGPETAPGKDRGLGVRAYRRSVLLRSCIEDYRGRPARRANDPDPTTFRRRRQLGAHGGDARCRSRNQAVAPS
jgi:hypothetical protein